ncbi:MAG: dTMP kinase [Halothiobacillaceae bacterium]
MTARGAFVTVEGSEGAGKSTALGHIAAWLRERQLPAHFSREPGGTRIGEQIRELLLDARHEGMAPMTELMLMFAARAQHVRECIEPALARGQWVICDRFTDSSHAYQGAGRGVADADIDALARLAHPDLTPDLTLLLDLPVCAGLARTRGRGQAPDRFEREQLAFFERVREAFLARAHADPNRFRVIDATRALPEVAESIRAALDEFHRAWTVPCGGTSAEVGRQSSSESP